MIRPQLRQHDREEPCAGRGGPVYCVIDGTLCEVRVWTEAEWAALGPSRRPIVCKQAPGLGWVGAVPTQVQPD